jgi:hypothetical protein
VLAVGRVISRLAAEVLVFAMEIAEGAVEEEEEEECGTRDVRDFDVRTREEVRCRKEQPEDAKGWGLDVGSVMIFWGMSVKDE